MSVRRSNAITPKVTRTNSIPSKTTTNNQLVQKIQRSNVVPPRKSKKAQQVSTNNKRIKMDYKSNNYFYNENDTNNEEDRYGEYYDHTQKEQKYDHETNDSYITVEQEDGNFKSVPKYLMEYNNQRNSPYINQQQYDEYYEGNSGEYENEELDNDEMYYENEEEYEEQEQEEIMEEPSHKKNMNQINQYPKVNKYYISQNSNNGNNERRNRINNNNNGINNKSNQNVISRPIHHQINDTNDTKRKTRTANGALRNYGNNTTTTNNTYNNNIYYINQNPVNVKNKNNQKKLNSKQNSVYKSVDLTINKRRGKKDLEDFNINNIEKSERSKYINSAILIQSMFRTFKVKLKVFNMVTLYVNIKRGVDILQQLLLHKYQKIFFKRCPQYISKKYDALLNAKFNLNLLTRYLRGNYRNNSTDKKYMSFHKELGDSFNIINKRENSEKKLKSKLNDVIKENTELKNQLVDNKNIEEKMKNLIDENKKNQNINAIIMKDNQQLAKKLKDFQDYRNTNLIVQNQNSLDLTQKELIEIDELIKNNDIYRKKMKFIYLGKFLDKKINGNKYLIKNYFDKYKNNVDKIKYKENEKNLKINMFLKNLVFVINNNIKLTKLNFFKTLYYYSIILNKETESKNILQKESLKNLLIKKEQTQKNILLKSFIKIYYNNKISEKKVDGESSPSEDRANKILKKYFNKCDYERRCILKSFMEKWMLTSKILGIRATARDKKKKRKLKKKNNKLNSQQNFGLLDKNKDKNAIFNNKFCRSIHEFSYIVSNGTVIKESSSNGKNEINFKNNKCSISSDKINKIKKFDKDVGIKKINSVNEINIQSNMKKDSKDISNKEKANSNAEESDEDSGDSLGLGNNSD